MTPEQETKFERMITDIRGEFRTKQEGLGELVLKARTAAEERDRKLGEAVIKISSDHTEGFKALQSLVELVRDELLEAGRQSEARITERLEAIKSDTHNLVNTAAAHAERIDSALAMGVKRAEEMKAFDATVRKALDDLSKGVAATYDRSGARRQVVDERVEADDAEAATEGRRG